MAWDRAGAWNSGVQGLSSVGSTIVIASGYQLLLSAGTLAAPGLAFELDPDTGIYRPGANILGLIAPTSISFGADGSGRWQIDASNFGPVTTGYDLGYTDKPVRFFYNSGGANGQVKNDLFLTELTTINAAASTDTAIQIPLNAVVYAVQVRVTVAIPTAATFTVTGATSGTQFDKAGGVSVNINTTDVGTGNCPYPNGAAQSIRITPNLSPATNVGRVRVTIHYYTITPATS